MDDNQKTHNYDGIIEQNNPMPFWWIVLFYVCICFSFLYWIHYEIAGAPTLADEYKVALEAHIATAAKNAPVAPAETEDSLKAFMAGENVLTIGHTVYKEKCAMCHGDNLEGKIGPNLTDQFWTTGDGSRVAVLSTIRIGSAAKGMPSWETMLKADELKSVAAYVYSKIGSNPANPKTAEGTEVKR